MKILFFVKTLGGGGAEKVLLDTIKNLDKKKYNITVYSLFNEGIYNNAVNRVVEYKYFFNKYPWVKVISNTDNYKIGVMVVMKNVRISIVKPTIIANIQINIISTKTSVVATSCV